MITIFSKTHRENCLFKSRIMDHSVYDQKIEEYFQFVHDKAKAKGFELKIIDGQHIYSFRAETIDEYDFIFYGVPTFWEWIN